jgi:predicted amidophosphoribosyltransferase
MELMKRKLRLDSGRAIDLYHLCYYLSKNTSRDSEQQLVLDFKNNEEQAVRRFIIEAIENLQHLGIDEDTLILRALSSKETKADQNMARGLRRLGTSLSWVFDCDHFPSMLYKKRVTEPIKNLGIAERKAELAGVYAVDQNIVDLNERKVLLIDDVVTTGATVSAIIDAILKAFPQTQVEVFSLAWTPTYWQQLALGLQERAAMYVNEPEEMYGGIKKEMVRDEDFENGETLVSIFASGCDEAGS